jgi:hypothetical protein
MKTKYETILNHLTSKEDEAIEWTTKPFSLGNYSAATDSVTLVVTPKIGDFIDMSEIVLNVIPKINMNVEISVQELKEKMSLIPFVDCYDDIEKDNECEACDGFGEVDYIFEYNGKTYEINEDCPICDGSGTIENKEKIPNGKKEYSTEQTIKIGVCHFYNYVLEKLIFVADVLEADTVNIISQTKSNCPCLFQIKEVEVLLMPTTNENNITTIKI